MTTLRIAPPVDNAAGADMFNLTTMTFAGDTLARAGHWWLLGRADNGISLDQAWGWANGAGVRVGVVDTGVNTAHLDLETDPVLGAQPLSVSEGPDSLSNPHGTRVAGLIMGRADNEIAGIGVAPGVEIQPTHLEFSQYMSVALIADTIAAQSAVDVSNNSWGIQGAFRDNFLTGSGSSLATALFESVTNGRDGLGTVFVFAGGNSRLMIGGENIGDDSNFHNLTNARQTIAVGATDWNGGTSIFSSPGTNLLISAPGQGLVTSDGLEAGAQEQATVSGTSFSSALVSGTVALMLEVNPALGYRDIQEILVLSARSSPGGQQTHAAHVNGGALHFDRDIGFGVLDAGAAVALARSWERQSTALNEAMVALDLGDVADPDGLSQTVNGFISAPDEGFRLQWAELRLNLSDPALRTLSIELVSPSGTRSVIAPNLTAVGGNSSLDFTFTSAATWGEDITGEWQVVLSHPQASEGFVVHDVELVFWGSSGAEDTHFITQSFVDLAAENQDRRAIGHAGAEQLNLVAVTDDIRLHLEDESGEIGALDVTLNAAFQSIYSGVGDDWIWAAEGRQRLYGGDGNDLIRGRGGNDSLQGEEGHDRLAGNAGDDVIRGGQGRDALFGGAGDDVLAGNAGRDQLSGGLGDDALFGGAGNDVLRGSAGNDTLHGGQGADILFGQSGADVFIWRDASESRPTAPDRVMDASSGVDKIDISALHASLHWSDSFTGQSGQVIYNQAAGLLAVDLDGDGQSDFSVLFNGAQALSEADFLL